MSVQNNLVIMSVQVPDGIVINFPAEAFSTIAYYGLYAKMISNGFNEVNSKCSIDP